MGRNNTIRGDLPREGCRGGKKFSWDQVEDDNQRVCYLGNSVAAPIGKWQRGRDIMWYSKNIELPIKSSMLQKNEIDLQKEKEQKLMSKVLSRGFGNQIDGSSEGNRIKEDKKQQFKIEKGKSSKAPSFKSRK